MGKNPCSGERVAEGEVEVPDLALTPALGCLQSSASGASGLGTSTAAREHMSNHSCVHKRIKREKRRIRAYQERKGITGCTGMLFLGTVCHFFSLLLFYFSDMNNLGN